MSRDRSSSRHTMKNVYLCVQCGEPSESLFKIFTPCALTLENCSRCGQVVDKYIEYDLTAVFIDVILLKISAFRHILFNTTSKAYLLRLVALTLLSSAYVEWAYQKQNTEGHDEQPVFFELEWGYYSICLQHIINLGVFTATFLLFTFITTKSCSVPDHFSYARIIEGIALSYCWNLVIIASLVWNHYSTYSILSQLALSVSCFHTFRVCVRPDYLISFFTVSCALLVQLSVSKWTRLIDGSIFCA